MANEILGEVDFPVGDKTYRLRLSINQIIQVEDLLGIGIIKIAGMFNDVDSLTAGSVRAVLWGALREHHPEVDIMGAGDIMAEARLQSTIEHVGRALQAAFPTAEGKETPSPKRGRAGNGKRST
ncbi:GTA-gp10 family protein [Devosia alba]|uniref:GTA-gp10 family protein n=1 Tax=Devosia alba TaxID=3152360 RepID=UPI0032648F66